MNLSYDTVLLLLIVAVLLMGIVTAVSATVAGVRLNNGEAFLVSGSMAIVCLAATAVAFFVLMRHCGDVADIRFALSVLAVSAFFAVWIAGYLIDDPQASRIIDWIGYGIVFLVLGVGIYQLSEKAYLLGAILVGGACLDLLKSSFGGAGEKT